MSNTRAVEAMTQTRSAPLRFVIGVMAGVKLSRNARLRYCATLRAGLARFRAIKDYVDYHVRTQHTTVLQSYASNAQAAHSPGIGPDLAFICNAFPESCAFSLECFACAGSRRGGSANGNDHRSHPGS